MVKKQALAKVLVRRQQYIGHIMLFFAHPFRVSIIIRTFGMKYLLFN